MSTRAFPCGPGIWKATEPPQCRTSTKSSYPFEQSIPPGNFTKQPSVPVRKGDEKPRACDFAVACPTADKGGQQLRYLTDGRHGHRTCAAPKITLVKTTQNRIHADDSRTRPETEPCKILTPSAATDRNQEQWLANQHKEVWTARPTQRGARTPAVQVSVALESGVASGVIRRARNSPEGAFNPSRWWAGRGICCSVPAGEPEVFFPPFFSFLNCL